MKFFKFSLIKIKKTLIPLALLLNSCFDANTFTSFVMATNIDGIETLKQKEIQEQANVEYSLNGLADQSKSEITWIKLHQMFDK